MRKQKQKWHVTASLFLTIIVVVAAALGFVYYFVGKSALLPGFRKAPTSPVGSEIGKSQKPSATRSTANWKTYVSPDKKMEFKYPGDLLSFSESDKGMSFVHSVPSKHVDPCDMRDGAAELSAITDFKADFQYLKKNLAGAVTASEQSFFLEEFLEGNTLKISPLYIDGVKFGSFEGYKITNSVEGCGEYVYYFILDDKNTLRVTRTIVAELGSTQTDSRENLKIPGIIKPEEEELIFERMISTLKWTGDGGIQKDAAELE